MKSSQTIQNNHLWKKYKNILGSLIIRILRCYKQCKSDHSSCNENSME